LRRRCRTLSCGAPPPGRQATRPVAAGPGEYHNSNSGGSTLGGPAFSIGGRPQRAPAAPRPAVGQGPARTRPRPAARAGRRTASAPGGGTAPAALLRPLRPGQGSMAAMPPPGAACRRSRSGHGAGRLTRRALQARQVGAAQPCSVVLPAMQPASCPAPGCCPARQLRRRCCCCARLCSQAPESMRAAAQRAPPAQRSASARATAGAAAATWRRRPGRAILTVTRLGAGAGLHSQSARGVTRPTAHVLQMRQVRGWVGLWWWWAYGGGGGECCTVCCCSGRCLRPALLVCGEELSLSVWKSPSCRLPPAGPGEYEGCSQAGWSGPAFSIGARHSRGSSRSREASPGPGHYDSAALGAAPAYSIGSRAGAAAAAAPGAGPEQQQSPGPGAYHDGTGTRTSTRPGAPAYTIGARAKEGPAAAAAAADALGPGAYSPRGPARSAPAFSIPSSRRPSGAGPAAGQADVPGGRQLAALACSGCKGVPHGWRCASAYQPRPLRPHRPGSIPARPRRRRLGARLDHGRQAIQCRQAAA
jgi:hypothetical protein